MSTMIDRLAPAIAILRELNDTLGRKVILGGGAVRDAILDRPIKDYDFWTAEGRDAPCDLAGRILHADELHTIDLDLTYDGHASLAGQECAGIISWRAGLLDCQLIVLRQQHPIDYEVMLARFDLGICQAGIELVNGEPVLRFTPAFTRDCLYKTMTYMKDPTDAPQVARSKARFERLSQKYPEFTFVLPSAAQEPLCL